jgi:hypothetical protein
MGREFSAAAGLKPAQILDALRGVRSAARRRLYQHFLNGISSAAVSAFPCATASLSVPSSILAALANHPFLALPLLLRQ